MKGGFMNTVAYTKEWNNSCLINIIYVSKENTKTEFVSTDSTSHYVLQFSPV